MIRRHSKKREGILRFLRQSTDHPSAEAIYRQLKPDYPDLSLGTVYRNLNDLCESGMVRAVAVVNDRERFDARTDPHAHAICSRCGRVLDVEAVELFPELIAAAQKATDFHIEYGKLQFVGLCADCQKNEEDENR